MSNISSHVLISLQRIVAGTEYEDIFTEIISLGKPHMDASFATHNYISLINEINMLNKDLDVHVNVVPLQKQPTHNDKFRGNATIVYNSVTTTVTDTTDFSDTKSCGNNICKIVFGHIQNLVKSLKLPRWYTPELLVGNALDANSTIERINDLVDEFLNIQDEVKGG